MARLETLTLAVSNPKAQKQFYCDMLGVSDQGKGRVGYNKNEVTLMFVDAKKPYKPQRADIYWKIAISVPNIELAYDQLSTRGVQVTKPSQSRDIGFLATATDPEGFTVELIDHRFDGYRPNQELGQSIQGGSPRLNLVT